MKALHDMGVAELGRALAAGTARVGGTRLGQRERGIGAQHRAELLVIGQACEQMCRQFNAGHLFRGHRAAEFGHALLVQRGAHEPITLGTRNRPSSTAGALRWLASR